MSQELAADLARHAADKGAAAFIETLTLGLDALPAGEAQVSFTTMFCVSFLGQMSATAAGAFMGIGAAPGDEPTRASAFNAQIALLEYLVTNLREAQKQASAT